MSNSDPYVWAENMGHVLDPELAFEPPDEDPCRACRGRGYDRRNPDEPCERCAGEGIEL